MPGTMPLAVASGSQSQTTFPPRSKSTTTTGPASPGIADSVRGRGPRLQRLEHVMRQVHRQPELAGAGTATADPSAPRRRPPPDAACRTGPAACRGIRFAGASDGGTSGVTRGWPGGAMFSALARATRHRSSRAARSRHGRLGSSGCADLEAVAAARERDAQHRGRRLAGVPQAAEQHREAVRLLGGELQPPQALADRDRRPSRAPRCRRPSAAPAPWPTPPAGRARRGRGRRRCRTAASAGAYGGCGGEIQASQPRLLVPARRPSHSPRASAGTHTGSARRCPCGRRGSRRVPATASRRRAGSGRALQTPWAGPAARPPRPAPGHARARDDAAVRRGTWDHPGSHRRLHARPASCRTTPTTTPSMISDSCLRSMRIGSKSWFSGSSHTTVPSCR